MTRRSLLLPTLALATLWLGVGCQASASGQAQAGSDGNAKLQAEGFADFNESSIEDEAGSTGEFAKDTEGPRDAALLGARHDVFVRTAPTENCRCIAAIAGQPNDARLGWESRIPRIDGATQMVFAFRMTDCADATEDGLGVSYRGYRKDEANVVVMVEPSVAGRPEIRGAIVPRPRQGGNLLVEPFPKSLTLGRSLADGAGPCAVDF